jgi:hypothetical protein
LQRLVDRLIEVQGELDDWLEQLEDDVVEAVAKEVRAELEGACFFVQAKRKGLHCAFPNGKAVPCWFLATVDLPCLFTLISALFSHVIACLFVYGAARIRPSLISREFPWIMYLCMRQPAD